MNRSKLFRCSVLAALTGTLAIPAAWTGPVSNYAMKKAVRGGVVWHPVDVETMDLLNGPGGEQSFKFREKVACKYEEKDPKNPLGGHSPKFPCWKDGVRLKIKYKPESNPEVYSEVAATRLFWALGFYAERMYSVDVVCENCPVDPWTDDGSQPRATRTFSPATIQTKLKGEQLWFSAGYHGWEYADLETVSERDGGASKAQVDAFKLLSVFVNHIDNTANQQKTLCLPEDAKCASPALYVTDLGGTFGGLSGGISFRKWSKKKIWKDSKACVADLKGTSGNYADPVISEDGRTFLAGLLSKLSDKQIADLFAGARFDDHARFEPPIPADQGKPRPLAISDWVKAFKAKRKEIADAKCPG
ncbi:MAG: hypothetical protein CO113_11690 [Elusimicrobia bacterium CG_4_9_14_3_um_filter_62_55]|nr:MAG: hypothetical protein COR54_00460 [Elusimicrobia bacterium CG22_combo_CG10-13_8_21_14_all_63_91]PJA15793.1 MAG: hypothetical protein COX66_09200 [Elusimicrobia bacterium CG_4_10_14_0_2_um_filter_63_34]PJB24885.1 MAG: hypothetical protein CO113_11690 [Elusimicrobia bacterium CG_4_9_14_3_um_filter_62_55]